MKSRLEMMARAVAVRSRVRAALKEVLFRTPTKPLWERVALEALVIVALFLNFFDLTPDRFPNAYYATAIKSMGQSWHNFYFLSFDPGGFVAIDKPPLAFWLQTLSVKLLGFNGFSVVLPQALAGVIAIIVLYHLVQRVFGGVAGILAALTLTLSPINVVTNRTNIVDSLLVLTVLLTAWALGKATATTKLSWLLLVGFLLGIGFNIKGLEAYLIVPALLLVYWGGTPLTPQKRLTYLGLMLLVTVVVSLSWSFSVDLTPANQRPYVGSSTTNSELALALGYNGIERLIKTYDAPTPQPATSRYQRAQIASASSPPGTGPAFWRLLTGAYGEQAGWLLPLALLGLLASAWSAAPRTLWQQWQAGQWSPRQQGIVLWGIWLVVTGIVLSFALYISPYYLIIFTPALAALAGMGLARFWADFWGKRPWLLLLGLMVTGIEQLTLLASVPQWLPWLRLLLIICLAMTVALFVACVWRRADIKTQGIDAMPALPSRIRQGLLISLVGVSLWAAPLLWTLGSLQPANESDHPIARPLLNTAGATNISPVSTDLLQYLRAQRQHAKFLVATVDTDAATPFILASGAPVMAMGGYHGVDPILTPDRLQRLVAQQVIRSFYLPSANLSTAAVKQLYPAVAPIPAPAFTNALTRWVSTTCLPVAPQAWDRTATTDHIAAMTLFVCG